MYIYLLFSGLLVILSLLFLTPYFSFIPRATLAAIIIAAVIFMVEVKVVRPMWRTKSKKTCFQKYQINLGYINELFVHVFRIRSHPGAVHVHRVFGVATRNRNSLWCWSKYSLYPVSCRKTENNCGETQGNCLIRYKKGILASASV